MENWARKYATILRMPGAGSFFFKGGFQNRFETDCLTPQQQLPPRLRKLEMPPFVINYIPAGHNCDFTCLLGHLRKQPPSPCSSSVFKSSQGEQSISQLIRTAAELIFMMLLQLPVASSVGCALEMHFSSLDCGPMAAQFQSCACQTGRHPGLPLGHRGR